MNTIHVSMFHASIWRRLPAALISLAACAGLHAHAQEGAAGQAPVPAVPAAAPNALTSPPARSDARKSAGDLSYKSVFATQQQLQSYQSPEPRVTDFSYRLSFSQARDAARDAYEPGTWAVAVVGDTFDHVVPVERGGYFLLPELPQAVRENATVMFNAETRWRSLEVAFKLRVSPQQTLAYADFARALQEFKTVQGQIPWYRFGLREIRKATMDGLRACFRTPDARIELDGVATKTVARGRCQVLRFDPAGSGQTISFVGQLDNVTLHDKDD